MFADTRNVTRRSSFSKAIQLPCQLSESNPPKNTSGSASHACHQCTGAHKARLCHVMGFGSKMNTKVAKQLSPLPFGIGPSRLRESPQTDWLPSRKTRLTRGRRMPPPPAEPAVATAAAAVNIAIVYVILFSTAGLG